MTDLEVIRKHIDEDSEALRRSSGSFRLCEARLVLSLADRRALLAEVERLQEERGKLQAFKDWVHAYLDAHGVPHHPPGSHGAAGCRIGDRMDWLMDRLAGAGVVLAPPDKSA